MQPLDQPEPADDRTIGDEDELWRRVSKVYWEPIADGWRISSAAFNNSSDGTGMSVHLASVAADRGIDLESLLPAPQEDFGVVSLTAGVVRAHGQVVVRKPEPNDPTHAEVVGRKSKQVRKRLRDAAIVLRVPPGM